MDCQVEKYTEMFPTSPSIKAATKIVIDGEVQVGKNVTIEGEFIVSQG